MTAHTVTADLVFLFLAVLALRARNTCTGKVSGGNPEGKKPLGGEGLYEQMGEQ
jgi:hypothetical protein